MSCFIYDSFPPKQFSTLSVKGKTQMLCKVPCFNTKNIHWKKCTVVKCSECRWWHTHIWCKRRHSHRLCSHSTLIEQSWRPRRTGFRFPGVQWTVSSPPSPLFLFSWLVIYFSHLHTLGWSSSQDLLLLTIVSGVVNQLFLWLWASFTLDRFHCSRTLARRPGNQQVHRQVCLDEDKAYWLATAAPRSSKLAVCTVMLWVRLGTARIVSFTQTKKKKKKTCCVFCCCYCSITTFTGQLCVSYNQWQVCVTLWLSGSFQK